MEAHHVDMDLFAAFPGMTSSTSSTASSSSSSMVASSGRASVAGRRMSLVSDPSLSPEAQAAQVHALMTVLEKHFNGDLSLFQRGVAVFCSKTRTAQIANGGATNLTASQYCWQAMSSDARNRVKSMDALKEFEAPDDDDDTNPGAGASSSNGSNSGGGGVGMSASSRSGDNDDESKGGMTISGDLKKKKSGLLTRVKNAVSETATLQKRQQMTQATQDLMRDVPHDVGLVRIHLVEARGVPRPKSGLIDAFVEVSVANVDSSVTMKKIQEVNKWTSAICERSSDPFWNATFDLAWSSCDDVLLFDVYAHGRSSDDFIGRVAVPLKVILLVCNTNAAKSLPSSPPPSSSSSTSSSAASLTQLANAFANDDVMATPQPNGNSLGRWFPLLSLQGEPQPMGSLYISFNTVRTPASQPLKLARPLAYSKVPSWTPSESLSLFTATWNVGNSPPPSSPAEMSAWLPPGHVIYAVAVQECGYSPRFDWQTARDDFIATIVQHLGTPYTLLKYHSLWDIRLAIFVANEYVPRVSDVTFDSVPTGVANLMGNKGGVLTTMQIDHTSVCFVAVHLAAHQDKTSARNDNFKEIVKRAKVGRPFMFNGGNHIDVLNQFDHVVWLGDLNYRISFGTDPSSRSPTLRDFHTLVEIIAEEGSPGLRAVASSDQLNLEKRASRAFLGFEEGPLSFRPTFKVARNDSLQYSSARLPAWCDRILWKSLSSWQDKLRLTTYSSAEEVQTSDHKPVFARFLLSTTVMPPALTQHCPAFGPLVASLVKLHPSATLAQANKFCPSLSVAVEIQGLSASSLLSVSERRGMNEEQRGPTGGSSGIVGVLKQVSRGLQSSATNPFVRITSPSMPLPFVSSTIKNSTNPSWPDVQMIRLRYNNPLRLEQTLFHCEVVSSGAASEVPVGYGLVTLRGIDFVKKVQQSLQALPKETYDPNATTVSSQLPSSATALSQSAAANVASPIPRSAITTTAVSIPFSVPLTYSGLATGQLTGTLRFFFYVLAN